MSASFVAASSQRLENVAPPITTYPFTVGIWAYPTDVSVQGVYWSLGDTGTTTNYFRMAHSSTGTWILNVDDGSGSAGILIGASVANAWTFLVGRFISATNRRFSVLQPNGSIVHGQSTTSRTPTSVDAMYLGTRVSSAPPDYLSGRLAEFWYTNADIQADAAQLQNSTLRQLAYNGPFSLPHIARNIVEYRSLRSRLDSRADTPEEVYWRGTRPVWTNTNAVTLGAHPPAADNYRSPLTEDAPMVIV